MNTVLKRISICAVAAVVLILTGGCTKARKAEGQMDTPQTHYKQGMKYFDADEFVKAEEEFKLSQTLDPDFAPAVAGLALTTAEKAKKLKDNDEADEGFKEALKLADKAKSINSKIPEVYIAKALVLTKKNEGNTPPEKWLGDVEKEYKKAIEIDPKNSEAYYRRGYCYKKAFQFSKAASDFKKVLDLNVRFTAEADEQWKIVQKIERAAPGSEVGKKIALVEKITRSDIAALFVSELQIDKLIKKKRPVKENTEFKAPDDPREMKVDETVKSVKEVTDLEGHWAKNFIMDIVALKIRGLEPFPDHTFHPDDLINRGQYAMMVEDIVVAISGDETLATKHIGAEKSRFPDVNTSHPCYNAICNAVDKGVMDADLKGLFKPEESVSGPDALLIIRKFKELNKI